jgi:hypothetical protein
MTSFYSSSLGQYLGTDDRRYPPIANGGNPLLSSALSKKKRRLMDGMLGYAEVK